MMGISVQNEVQWNGTARLPTNGTLLRSAWIGGAFHQRLNEVSYRKENDAHDDTTDVEIMTGAMLSSPMHPSEYAKPFANMSEDDHSQTSGTD
jgi:hypothetical protein